MKILFLLFLILTRITTNSQPIFDFTTQSNRAKHDVSLKRLIHRSLQQPLSFTTEKEWMKAFWAMEFLLYKTPYTKQKLAAAWKVAGELSESFQKAFLEVNYTLYPSQFTTQVNELLKTTASPLVFIRCAEYLLLNNQANRFEIETVLQQKFAGNDFIGFAILKQRLEKTKAENIPPLKDIVAKKFLPGQTVVYSLQRRNRNFAGLVLIRKPDGSFIKAGDGKLFNAAQLARAITNYPFYITNGNTPQGIFKWTGFDTSTISYIGPTANLQMVMPYETSPAVFMNDSSKTWPGWNQQLYESLLPRSWTAYKGIYESFLAGAIGRSEIIMHGTTINPDYYKGQPYFPQTPSLGCLCSYEKWDKTGKRVVSNQQTIVDALNSIGSKMGYVVVIDLDDKKSAVTLEEVVAALK